MELEAENYSPGIDWVADGSIVTWGVANHGGNSEDVKEALTSGMQHTYSTRTAIAAVKTDGSVVTWGRR